MNSLNELNTGQQKALIATLQNALDQLNMGNTMAAINLLNAFIDQVNVFIAVGVLSPVEGQPLINEANEIINQLSG
ncbi:MAG: hypothetical protein AABZ05_00610 [Nitrospirota bacterium]|mgnify:CR=1 FL=1